MYSNNLIKFKYLDVKLINDKAFDKSEYLIIKDQQTFNGLFSINDSTKIDFSKNIVIAVYDNNPDSRVEIEGVRLNMEKVAHYNQGGILYISYNIDNESGLQYSVVVIPDIEFYKVKCFKQKKSERRQDWRFGD